MKAIRLFSFIFCCLWVDGAYSQTVTEYELWFDDDCNSRMSVSGGSQLKTSFDVSSLSASIHRLHVRAKDSEDRLSVTACKYFYYNPDVLPTDKEVTIEYWIDDDTNTRQSVEASGGVAELSLDVSGLSASIHRLHVRAKDSEDHWSVTASRYFYYNPDVLPADSAVTYEYWIDDDYEARVNGSSSDGIILFDLPIDQLSHSIHRLHVRAQDSKGNWSVTACRYFLRPWPWLDGNMISGYKYWANGVLEADVELDEANPYTDDNLLIDITGVVPLELTSDYTMDWATKTVTSPGDLYFAISFGDNVEQWSFPAIDTLYYDYPQKVDVEEMYNVASSDITSACKGRMYGFHYNISEGDFIIWTVDSACCVDIYDDFGNRTAHHEMASDGGTIEVTAAIDGSYAFVYNIEGDQLTVTSRSNLLSGITSAIADDMVKVDGNRVTVNASGVTCRVYDTRGILYALVTTGAAGETFTLTSGIYIITLTDTAHHTSKLKLLIP